jgi:hypothetical protein
VEREDGNGGRYKSNYRSFPLPFIRPDAIARAHGLRVAYRLSTEIGVPGLATRTCRLRECLTLTISAF